MLVGNDTQLIEKAFSKLHAGNWQQGQPIPKWDGKASQRIVEILVKLHEG